MTCATYRPTVTRFVVLGLFLVAGFGSIPRGTSAALPAPAPSASARAATPPPTATPSSGPNALPALGSTLVQIATHLAADIGSDTKPSVVSTATLRSDEPAPRGAELAGKVAVLLAGKLRSAVAKPEPTSLAAAEAGARRATWLVYLQTEIAGGLLRVTADVYPAIHNVWERVREPVPLPTKHAYAAGRIDGEVRSYLASVPLVGARIDRATLDDEEIVALSCGDLDDDGTLEIVTLSRRRIALGRARGGRFVTLRSALLRDFSGIAPIPLREPLGGVVIVPARRGPPHLDVGISDRARGSRLDGELKWLGAITGVPFATPYGDACRQFQGSALTTTVAKCADADPAFPPFDVDGPVDTVATAVFVTAQGVAYAVDAARDSSTGDVALRSHGRTANLAHSGAQMALADLDQDGAPEVITTLDVLPGPQGVDDALVITTWETNGSLREKSRLPVPTGVRAVAACPPEGGGSGSVVVATAGELWIVR